MLYAVSADMGGYTLLDLDGDGVAETKAPNVQVMTVEAATGDEAAALAVAQGAKFVRGVDVAVPAAEPAVEKRGPGRPKKAG